MIGITGMLMIKLMILKDTKMDNKNTNITTN